MLPQLGHVTFALVRSVMLRAISKPFSHFSHMYSSDMDSVAGG